MLTVSVLVIATTLLILWLDNIQWDFLTGTLKIKRKKKNIFSGDTGKANAAFKSYMEHEATLIQLIDDYARMDGAEDVNKVDPAALRQEVGQIQTTAKAARGASNVAQAFQKADGELGDTET